LAIARLWLAHDLLTKRSMRSILILFAIAAVGFFFLIQKKDAPEIAPAERTSAEVNRMGEHNWVKRPLGLDRSRDVAQNSAR
jgi:hypothetical protein